MKRTVVTLFDGCEARAEAVAYAVELAARLDSTLVLLMLVGHDDRADDCTETFAARARAAIAPHLRTAESAGVRVEAVLRVGDPYSELMKYLAQSHADATIVWGGEKAALRPGRRGQRPHWLMRARDSVDLPVVVPSPRP
jgi:hypothetical protein